MYEVFMPIENYEDTYAVSNLGRVKNIKTGKILKEFKNNKGYMLVHLYKNGIEKKYLVHRLVLNTFQANPRKCSDVNHRNEDKTDNRLNNLEWISHKDNCNFGTRNKRFAATKKANGDYEKIAKKISIPVYCITNNTVYKSAHEAARQLNISQSSITACCKGQYKQIKGYKFEYYNQEGDE